MPSEESSWREEIDFCHFYRFESAQIQLTQQLLQHIHTLPEIGRIWDQDIVNDYSGNNAGEEGEAA